MAKGENKTNVMRILDAAKIKYRSHCYLESGAISGVDVARALGQNEDRVFKTLVTTAPKTKKYYVFVIPVARELDLKKAASAVGEKSIEMLHSKDLLPVTGYIHGGCSPIGMKKQFATVVHQSFESFENVMFSAGKIGWQVEMSPEDLKRIIPYSSADVVTVQ